MKKYKLIKEYPGSPKLNTILKQDGNFYTSPINQQIFRCNREVEKYPEFWEEVVEKDYEILSFIHDGSRGVSKHYIVPMKNGYLDSDYQHLPESHYLNSKCWNIHSVKRLSDGEISTIGDEVGYNYGKGYCYNSEMNKWKPAVAVSNNTIIENIEIIDNKITIKTSYNRFYYTIDSYSKNKKPLFKTEDGVDIYEGDSYYYVCKSTFSHYHVEKTRPLFDKKRDNFLDFSTKEALEEYIIMNKPCLSINEVATIYKTANLYSSSRIAFSGWDERAYKLRNLVKEKLNQI